MYGTSLTPFCKKVWDSRHGISEEMVKDYKVINFQES